MILSPVSIRRAKIITPCLEATKYLGVTFGMSHAGYDIRIAEEHVIPPKGFVLGSAVEHFALPNYVLGVVHDKSTWARRGVAVLNTVMEPGWKG